MEAHRKMNLTAVIHLTGWSGLYSLICLFTPLINVDAAATVFQIPC